MKARTVWAVAAAAVVAVGSIGAGTARGASSHTYRCVGDIGADGGANVILLNPGSKSVAVEATYREDDGTVDGTATLQVPAKGTNGTGLLQIQSFEFRSPSKLLVDGYALYDNGSGPDIIREIRCS